MINKPKHQIPSIEELSVNTPYALTLNHKYQGLTPSETQGNYRELLTAWSFTGVQWELFPELSKYGRYHLHGYLTFPTVKSIALFYYGMPVTIEKCTICIKDMDHIAELSKGEGWSQYIAKQRSVMKVYCKHFEIPYKLNNDNLSDMGRNTRQQFSAYLDEPTSAKVSSGVS